MNLECKILCVEDNIDSCEVIRELIEGSGRPYTVKAAYNTEHALELIAAEHFDLYILDIWVPEMGGLQLSKKIRETDPTTPIIFFTGLDSEPSKKKAFAAGANEFLTKSNDI